VGLSGLGDKKMLNAKSIDDRYKSISEAAVSRSIISLGLSCFSEIGESDGSINNSHVLKTQTYNFLTLCDDDFVVEPGSVRFLVDHGFDFNLQYAKGLPYLRGSRRTGTTEQISSGKMTLRGLFKEILSARKPIVLHNGLVDLIFLYGNFLTDLPSSLQTFVADIAELFPSGIYDTKFVADFCARYTASYLEYVFRKCQRENEVEVKAGRPHLEIQLPQFTSNIEKWVELAACSVPTGRNVEAENLCSVFLAHGWCKDGRNCSLSHDIDAILDLEEAKLEKKRAKKRRRKNAGQKTETADAIGEEESNQVIVEDQATNAMDTRAKEGNGSVSGQDQQKSPPLYTGAHRAGYDAFMTAFSLAFLTVKLNQWPTGGEKGIFDVAMFKNKIALSGKEYPLAIQRSTYAKPSQTILDFMQTL